MKDLPVKVGQEISIHIGLFGADNELGASYDETEDVTYLNAQDAIANVMHNGGLTAKIKGIAPGTSYLQALVKNHAGIKIQIEGNIVVTTDEPPPPPIRDAVRGEFFIDG